MSSLLQSIKEHKIYKYIFGLFKEVVVIIIGILLALQINTWVGERADRNALKSNLNYVLEDLSLNDTALSEEKEKKVLSKLQCTSLINNYKQNKSVHSEEIIKTLISILSVNRLIINLNGFEIIKTSNLYDTAEFFEVRNKIREYNNILVKLSYKENFINSYVSNLSLEMSKNGALFKLFDFIRMNKEITHFTVSEILENNIPLQAVLYKYEFDSPKLINYYDDLTKTGAELEEAVNRYLKQ
jgi:hypothetical protein